MNRRPPSAVIRGLVALFAVVVCIPVPRPIAAQTMDHMNFLFFMVDDLEPAWGLEGRPVLLDAEGWYGGDIDRLWFKVEGRASTREREGEIESQLLFSRLVAPFWDLQAGVRVDRSWGDGSDTRPHITLGIQGLAPYWFEVESALYVDADGKASADMTVAYDLLLAQRLVLEPEIEIDFAFQDVPDWRIQRGVNDFGLGARLRYEIRREVAPYVGFLWSRSFGGTSDLRRAAGVPHREGTFVFGIRAWR